MVAAWLVSGLGEEPGAGEEPLPPLLWYFYAGMACFLVVMAGMASGLTLALMGISERDLEVRGQALL